MSDFQNGIFGCCDNGIVWFLKLYCCAPCTTGYVAESIGENCLVYGCCAGLLQPCLRQKVRANKGINNPGIITDLFFGWCCGLCSIGQLARECGVEPGLTRA
eukprot:m.284676 g.284676  ORF g.284676 m.284676 type:complete len:102 (-) comp11195_c0_seq1:101-406(-)